MTPLVETKGLPMTCLTLAELNTTTAKRFEMLLGDVVEASPWVARGVARERPFATVDALAVAFRRVLYRAGRARQLLVFRAHPDLATRLDGLSEASSAEQRGAGLQTLSAAERERFAELNEGYRVKFGFPFLFAVKGATPAQILEAFEARLPNDVDTEVVIALEQVARIVTHRLRDRIS